MVQAGRQRSTMSAVFLLPGWGMATAGFTAEEGLDHAVAPPGFSVAILSREQECDEKGMSHRGNKSGYRFRYPLRHSSSPVRPYAHTSFLISGRLGADKWDFVSRAEDGANGGCKERGLNPVFRIRRRHL